MKKIAFWAAANPAYARLIIGCAHILLIINALWLGLCLYALEVRVPTALTGGLALLFAAAFLLYPQKATRYYTFLWRKTADFVLIATHVWALSGYANAYCFFQDRMQLEIERTTAFMPVATRTYPAESPSFSKQVKSLRHLLRQIKTEAKPMALGVKILLISLTVLASLWLVLLITLLACNIACSGYEGLATVMLILGWAGVVFLAVWLIRLIAKRPAKQT
jgi:hypothetical protein